MSMFPGQGSRGKKASGGEGSKLGMPIGEPDRVPTSQMLLRRRHISSTSSDFRKTKPTCYGNGEEKKDCDQT